MLAHAVTKTVKSSSQYKYSVQWLSLLCIKFVGYVHYYNVLKASLAITRFCVYGRQSCRTWTCRVLLQQGRVYIASIFN